jgi:hypothetical protein
MNELSSIDDVLLMIERYPAAVHVSFENASSLFTHGMLKTM